MSIVLGFRVYCPWFWWLLSRQVNVQIDPIGYREFANWRQQPTLDDNGDSAFLQRILQEDVIPSLCFKNKTVSSSFCIVRLYHFVSLGYIIYHQLYHHPWVISLQLADQIYSAIRANTLELEPLNESKETEEKTCALNGTSSSCSYRLRIDAQSDWLLISELVRNRVDQSCGYVNVEGVIDCCHL